jgi:rhomboid protease GluP
LPASSRDIDAFVKSEFAAMNENGKTALLCPNCRRLVSADESRCPHCGATRPGAWWKNNALTRALYDQSGLVRAVIALNIGMYLLSLMINSRLPALTMNPFALLSPENRSLLFLGATGSIPIERFGRVWTVVSAMYLHGGLLHILFNMIAFSQLAPRVIREFGAFRSSAIYTIGGALGYVISYRVGVTFTIGASGAICALIGALLYYGKSRGGIYGQALFRHVGGWAVGILIFGLLVPGINNWAHGGGFVAGIALAYLLGYQERRRESGLDRLLGVASGVATAAILLWAAGSGLVLRYQG